MEAYIDGFRRSDHEAIPACLADVVWGLHGYRAPGRRLETFHINLGGPGAGSR